MKSSIYIDKLPFTVISTSDNVALSQTLNLFGCYEDQKTIVISRAKHQNSASENYTLASCGIIPNELIAQASREYPDRFCWYIMMRCVATEEIHQRICDFLVP